MTPSTKRPTTTSTLTVKTCMVSLSKYFITALDIMSASMCTTRRSTKPLGPGNVFTLEPGIYIPEEGIGIRIEDVVYIDATGRPGRPDRNTTARAKDVETAMHK